MSGRAAASGTGGAADPMRSLILPRVYLDYAAAAPPAAAASAAYAAYQQQHYVNPHGGTEYAESNRRVILESEARLLESLGIAAGEAAVIWCSGCTEALNLALRGSRWSGPRRPLLYDHSAHPAMLEPVRQRQREGTPAHAVRVDAGGQSCPDAMPSDTDPGLLAICHVNNETGVIQDLPGWRRAMGEAPLLAVDAAQSLGQVPIPWHEAAIDLLALSGRKVGCPAPLGVLVCRKRVRLTAQILGGGQQRGMRSGTLDTAAIRIFAETAVAAVQHQPAQRVQMSGLQRLLRQGLEELGQGRWPVFSPVSGSPHLCSFAIPGQEGALVVRRLAVTHGIVLAAGSACSAEQGKPSHVLQAMGVPAAMAMGAIRVSFGRGSTEADVQALLQALKEL